MSVQIVEGILFIEVVISPQIMYVSLVIEVLMQLYAVVDAYLRSAELSFKVQFGSEFKKVRETDPQKFEISAVCVICIMKHCEMCELLVASNFWPSSLTMVAFREPICIRISKFSEFRLFQNSRNSSVSEILIPNYDSEFSRSLAIINL